MAKRSRGPSRPGQRRPGQRTTRLAPPSRPSVAAPRPVIGLTEAEESRAAELEAGIMAQERAIESARRPGRERSRGADDDALALRGRPRSALAVRFADEYAYVARDLRRIAILAAILVAILVGLFLVIEVAGAVKL